MGWLFEVVCLALRVPRHDSPAMEVNSCETSICLRICCRNLVNTDILSKSDPSVIVQQKCGSSWTKIGSTERISNNLNPEFSETIQVDYYFEQVQKLRFVVMDVDRTDDDDLLGQLEITLGQIVSSKCITKNLKDKHAKELKSEIIITADETYSNKEFICLVLHGQKLDKKDFLSKSDPFLEFWWHDKSVQRDVLLHRTEVIQNTLDPAWSPFRLPVNKLDPVVVRCWDWDRDGSNDLIGEAQVSSADLRDVNSQIPLLHPKKASKKKYTNSGVLLISSSKIQTEYTFLDFVMGGCSLNFTVGFDFTGSNGDQRHRGSLHFLEVNQATQYERALQAIGHVVQDYDTDKQFPAFGFGAFTPLDPRSVSHEFALNLNPDNPYCNGVVGIAHAYRSILPQLRFSGPTLFSPIIKHVMRFAAQAAASPDASQYFILLMLTDGAITDVDETVDVIVEASDLPMSIIIVGVGEADFKTMNLLDGDEGKGLKSSCGNRATRDIVQFVAMRDFNLAEMGHLLAKQLLAEVPKQLTSYYNSKGMSPMLPTINR